MMMALVMLLYVGAMSPRVLGQETDGCGDLNQNGSFGSDDLMQLHDYLYAGGPALDSLELANFDGRGGINLGDLVPMYVWLVQFQPFLYLEGNACRNSVESYPINPAETVYVRNHVIPAGASNHVVEVWANRTWNNLALAFPFAFSCTAGPVALDSIIVNSNLLRNEEFIQIDSSTQHGFVGYHRGFHYGVTGKYRIASLYFSVTAQAIEQQIILDTATWFGEETFLSWSYADDSLLSGSMRPLLYGTPSTPDQPPSCCDFRTCDVNLSGAFSITDLTLLANHLFVTFEPLACRRLPILTAIRTA